MSRALSIFLACALIFAAVVAQEEEVAAVQEEVAPAQEEPFVGNENGYSLLVARRTFLQDSFVENTEMTVRIQIWNLGTKEALNVVVHEAYPESMFTKVEDKVFDKILATENVTYEYTVKPTSHGFARIPRTQIKYDDKEAYVDLHLDLIVESPEQYAKRTDLHVIDWIVYVVGSLVVAGVPAIILYKKNESFQ